VNDGLHHGLPCVVSEAVGSGTDLIEPGVTGAVFKTGSAEGLAAAIAEVLPLTNQPNTRLRCREKVNGYTVEKAAAGIAEAFFAVAGAPRPLAHCI
jgi:glycosyltransferase involved in cell wall biosynthesis